MFAGEVEVFERLEGPGARISVEGAHREGLWHPAVHVYLTDGERVMQRLAHDDPQFGGVPRRVWDMSFLAGDVFAGEAPEEAVWRIAAEAGLELQGLYFMNLTTETELWQTGDEGPFCHRTVDWNFAAHHSSLPSVGADGTRFYPIRSLIDDMFHSLRHEARYRHVSRGPRNEEIYSNVLEILAKYGKA